MTNKPEKITIPCKDCTWRNLHDIVPSQAAIESGDVSNLEISDPFACNKNLDESGLRILREQILPDCQFEVSYTQHPSLENTTTTREPSLTQQ